MRELFSHRTGVVNEHVRVVAVDQPGPGGAHHQYVLSYRNKEGVGTHSEVSFQKGPVAEVGVNGLTNEALLAVLIDRMRGFQSGPFACRENAIALTKLEEALHWLQHRTREREARGVEGKSQK